MVKLGKVVLVFSDLYDSYWKPIYLRLEQRRAGAKKTIEIVSDLSNRFNTQHFL